MEETYKKGDIVDFKPNWNLLVVRQGMIVRSTWRYCRVRQLDNNHISDIPNAHILRKNIIWTLKYLKNTKLDK